MAKNETNLNSETDNDYDGGKMIDAVNKGTGLRTVVKQMNK